MGTASAMPISYRNPSAQVLCVRGRLFLIDCGEGTQQQLRRAKISFVKIEAIFISHIHGDHVFGLFGLLRSMAMYGRTGDLHIYGPQALGSILNFFASFFGEGLSYKYIFTPVKAKSPEVIHISKHIQVSAFPLNHKIECYGYRFDELPRLQTLNYSCQFERDDNSASSCVNSAALDLADPANQVVVPQQHLKSFAYCSDTAPFPQLADWVRGVDLLFHEATYTQDCEQNAVKYYHSCSTHAAACARDAAVGQLIVGHYSAKIRDFDAYLAECQSIFPRTSLAKELDSIDF